LTSVWHDTNMADVIMDSGHITTVFRADIKNAAQRMNKSTKAWDSSDYVKGFKPSIEKRLLDHWDTFLLGRKKNKLGFSQTLALLLQRDEPAANLREVRMGLPAGPKKGKSTWKLNTQVATNKSVDLAGVASGGTGDSLAPEMFFSL
jgi:hypothetical protein